MLKRIGAVVLTTDRPTLLTDFLLQKATVALPALRGIAAAVWGFFVA